MGKGSGARPFSVSQMDFAKNYELTFGKKNRNENGDSTTRQDLSTGKTDSGSSEPTQTDSSEPRGTA